MNFLQGKKTYIVGLVAILLGVGKMVGFDVPGFESIDAGTMILNGIAALTLRGAIAKGV